MYSETRMRNVVPLQGACSIYARDWGYRGSDKGMCNGISINLGKL